MYKHVQHAQADSGWCTPSAERIHFMRASVLRLRVVCSIQSDPKHEHTNSATLAFMKEPDSDRTLGGMNAAVRLSPSGNRSSMLHVVRGARAKLCATCFAAMSDKQGIDVLGVAVEVVLLAEAHLEELDVAPGA